MVWCRGYIEALIKLGFKMIKKYLKKVKTF